MLTDQEILEILANNRTDVPFTIDTTFTDARNTRLLNRRIFYSAILPVAPALTFFESSAHSKNEYCLSSFFSTSSTDYSIIPFGTKRTPADDEQDLGISYNVFQGSLPLQSYTICQPAELEVPKRGAKQTEYFKETNCNHTLWSAGHLIAHSYTPVFARPELAATLQYDKNFIPEPYVWNCHQRNPLERRCRNGYYAVYPIYDLRYLHGRTVKAVRSNKLPYRPIPDGEFFVGHTADNDRFQLFMPFIGSEYKVYDSKVYSNVRSKIDVTVQKHKVNSRACPENITLDFNGEDWDVLRSKMNKRRLGDQNLIVAQGDLFVDRTSNPLHHAAVICTERAATLETRSPQNKMRAALIFSSLGNAKKQKLYLRAAGEHAKILLDKCDAENPPVKLFSQRLLKSFKQEFAEESSIVDILERLKFKAGH